jgi:hypothetical protein
MVSHLDRTTEFSENAPESGRFAPDHTRELGAADSMSSTPLSETEAGLPKRRATAVSESSDDSEEADSHETTANNPAEHSRLSDPDSAGGFIKLMQQWHLDMEFAFQKARCTPSNTLRDCSPQLLK